MDIMGSGPELGCQGALCSEGHVGLAKFAGLHSHYSLWRLPDTVLEGCH